MNSHYNITPHLLHTSDIANLLIYACKGYTGIIIYIYIYIIYMYIYIYVYIYIMHVYVYIDDLQFVPINKG